MTVSARLIYSLREIPFSRKGSWLNLSPVAKPHHMSDSVHLVSHRGTELVGLLSVDPTAADGTPVTVDATTATPASVEWKHENGSVRAAFATASAVRVRGEGLGLRLRVPDVHARSCYVFIEPGTGAVVIESGWTGRRTRVRALEGTLATEILHDGDWTGTITAGTAWEVVIEEIGTTAPAFADSRTFGQVVEDTADEFTRYCDAIIPWRTCQTPAAELAAYVLWSATVDPSGFLRRPGVLMSKHWMDRVWSWDHCFNALALAPGLPDAAIDQFFIPFDHQDPSGGLPDMVGHSLVTYNFTKPPIHGWTIDRLQDSLPDLAPEQLRSLYRSLASVTRFWLDARRLPGHALPYYEHGNDSGWDNSTMFDRERVVEAPDLAAFLLVQLSTLARLADLVGEPAAPWVAMRDELATALVTELWTGEEFIAKGADDQIPSHSLSLLRLLPLLAAEHLPEHVVQGMIANVDAHLTEFGPATEAPSSPEYGADGYWRGPIWAPSTVLLEAGLRTAGATDLADRVSDRFRRLCEQSGFAENFDALTGSPLRDTSYTWTASCYLLLAREHVARAASV